MQELGQRQRRRQVREQRLERVQEPEQGLELQQERHLRAVQRRLGLLEIENALTNPKTLGTLNNQVCFTNRHDWHNRCAKERHRAQHILADNDDILRRRCGLYACHAPIELDPEDPTRQRETDGHSEPLCLIHPRPCSRPISPDQCPVVGIVVSAPDDGGLVRIFSLPK